MFGNPTLDTWFVAGCCWLQRMIPRGGGGGDCRTIPVACKMSLDRSSDQPSFALGSQLQLIVILFRGSRPGFSRRQPPVFYCRPGGAKQPPTIAPRRYRKIETQVDLPIDYPPLENGLDGLPTYALHFPRAPECETRVRPAARIWRVGSG